MLPKCLKSYTTVFKLSVVEKAEIIGNQAVGLEFRVCVCC